MAGTFLDTLIPSLAQAGGQAGLGALTGQTQGILENRKYQHEQAMEALRRMMAQQTGEYHKGMLGIQGEKIDLLGQQVGEKKSQFEQTLAQKDKFHKDAMENFDRQLYQRGLMRGADGVIYNMNPVMPPAPVRTPGTSPPSPHPSGQTPVGTDPAKPPALTPPKRQPGGSKGRLDQIVADYLAGKPLSQLEKGWAETEIARRKKLSAPPESTVTVKPPGMLGGVGAAFKGKDRERFMKAYGDAQAFIQKEGLEVAKGIMNSLPPNLSVERMAMMQAIMEAGK